tara:strand:- start:1748 stop:2011 length:264 start_codon:yes stop_codon:yes gene_type:complete
MGKENIGAMKTPSLGNLGLTAPYGHAGQHKSLTSVIEHYEQASDALVGHSEAKPLALLAVGKIGLVVFSLALDAPLATWVHWLSPPA